MQQKRASRNEGGSMIFPPPLRKGDTVGLVCPSSPVNEERIAGCVEAVEKMGYRVKTADNLGKNYRGYMAGDEEERARWINIMFADEKVGAVFCVRGGHGSSRIMEYLDFEMIKRNPKIFVGYSDVTNIHMAINKICGFVTFHGPMVSSNMVDDFDKETKGSFFSALEGRMGYVFENPPECKVKILKKGQAESQRPAEMGTGLARKGKEDEDGKVTAWGKKGDENRKVLARGRLTGGNLSLLSAGIGTAYEVDTAGKILFIEEVAETIGKIEKWMYHLRNSGKLAQCKGILLGQFSQMKGCTEEEILTCVEDGIKDVNIPVFYNIQSGHGKPMMTLPLGAMCILRGDKDVDGERGIIEFTGEKEKIEFTGEKEKIEFTGKKEKKFYTEKGMGWEVER